jgi:hypothetical protein
MRTRSVPFSMATVLLLTAALSVPVAAAPTSGGIGFIDSPEHGATFTRAMGAPGVNIDYKASGMRVWIQGAPANQSYIVSTLFTISRNGVALPPSAGHGFILIQCDGGGDWEELAGGTGVLPQLAYGTGPGSHTCEILCSLQVTNPDTLSVTYPHSHSFTVN